ncbi:MAG: SPOR domain-containing protein [Zoogloeaceae bacterium]|jgi:cell division protein FtsN|nr:SPOR domain-containing protein [Zoogloeaceae bacterium]
MKTAQHGARHSSQGGTLVGMFVGLVLGVVIAATVVWYTQRMEAPFTSAAPPTQNIQPDQGQPPVALPGKPGDAVTPENRFQFYDILPGNTTAVPQPPSTANVAVSAPAVPIPMPVKLHYLQAGAFSNPQEADNLKASLAMKGMEAHVQQVMVQGNTFFRLRLGPYSKIDEASSTRAKLAQQGVETLLINVEE